MWIHRCPFQWVSLSLSSLPPYLPLPPTLSLSHVTCVRMSSETRRCWILPFAAGVINGCELPKIGTGTQKPRCWSSSVFFFSFGSNCLYTFEVNSLWKFRTICDYLILMRAILHFYEWRYICMHMHAFVCLGACVCVPWLMMSRINFHGSFTLYTALMVMASLPSQLALFKTFNWNSRHAII